MKIWANVFIVVGVIMTVLAFAMALTCAEPSKEAGDFPGKLCKWLLAIGLLLVVIGGIIRIAFV